MPTTTISPTADGMIKEDQAAVAFGTATTIDLYQDTGQANKARFTFDLSSVPAGTITAAAFKVRQTTNTAAGITTDVDRISPAYANTDTWTGTSTNETTPSSSLTWISGTDGACVRRAVFEGADLITLINDAITSRSGILSFGFTLTTGAGAWSVMISRENLTVDERPILEIETSGGVIGGGGATGNAKAIPLGIVLP